MANKQKISKENLASIAAVYYVALGTLQKVLGDENVDQSKLETLITNKVLKKCTTQGV